MTNLYEQLSIILSPQAIALYMILIFSFFSPIGLGSADPVSSIAIGLVFLVLIPFYAVHRFSKKLIDLEREERTIPYLVSIVGYAVASIIFWYMDSKIMFLLSLIYLCVVSAIFMVNFFWKISAHAAGAAGPTTALVFMFGTALIPLYALTLLITWARFKLGVHNVAQL